MINKLTIEHLHLVREVARESFPLLWSPCDFSFFLTHPNSFCFGYFEDRYRLAAFLLALLIEGEVDISSIATVKERRRQGLARELLSYAVSHSSVKSMALEVSTKNEGAINLYKNFGFTLVAFRKGYYSNGEDAFIMRYIKTLDTPGNSPFHKLHRTEKQY